MEQVDKKRPMISALMLLVKRQEGHPA